MNNNLICINNFFQNEAFEGAPFTFGLTHLIFIAFTFITTPLFAFLLRKLDHKKIKIGLIIYWILSVGFEIWKFTWDSISRGHINYPGNLALYLCSIPLYIMPFVIWGKGKVQQCAKGFMCTFAIIGAVANIIYPSILEWYPVFSFSGLHSMLYHYFMLFVALWMWFSKYYVPTSFKDSVYSFMPLAIFSIPVIIIDKIFNYDYMFYNGNFFPFTIISSKMPSWLWTIVLFIGYYIVNTLIFYIPLLIKDIKKKKDS